MRTFPVSIDLGSKHTGLFLCELNDSEKKPVVSESVGCLIEMTDLITFKMTERRQKRHQKRNIIRLKMAKRLLLVILKDVYNWDFNTMTYKEKEWVFGLMNRRGFSRASEELDISSLKQVPFQIYQHFFTNLFNIEEPIETTIRKREADEEWLKIIIDKFSSIEEVIGNKTTVISKEKWAAFETNYPDLCNKKDIEDIIKNMKEWAIKQIDALKTGSKHRKKYFEEIKMEVERTPLGSKWFQNGLSKEQLWKLACHISNFQLRVLRRYFNGNPDGWKPETLFKVLNRWVRSWHAKMPDEKMNQSDLVTFFKNHKAKEEDILDLFNMEPEKTIPPYEDMNNRRIPKCKSVILDPVVLDKRFGNWQTITNKLSENEKCMSDEISVNVDEKEKKARVLMRFLDRVRKYDPYGFRDLCYNGNNETAQRKKAGDETRLSQYLDRLEMVLEPSEVGELIDLGKAYYRSIETARSGLWNKDDGNTILTVCNKKPKMKRNQQTELLRQIIRKKVSEKEVREFKQFWKDQKIGRATIFGIARKAYEFIKDEGTAGFQVLLESRDKKAIELSMECSEAAKRIADHFSQNDGEWEKYKSPFSLSQLYSHLEKDISGFSSTCPHCMMDNNWRMDVVTVLDDENKKASAVRSGRLSSDAVRPFDGFLARLVDRLAFEIAKKQIDLLTRLGVRDDEKVFIPIFIEENRFQFSADLKTLKKIPKKGPEQIADPFLKKTERIMASSNGICAYTGKKIGQNGEIDHIIPRSKTRDVFGTIFNSEANLIYVSVDGNRDKGNKIYSLGELDKVYLKKQFGTGDITEITDMIKKGIENYIKDRSRQEFNRLAPEVQRALRHALFVKEFRKDAMKSLQTAITSRVNGTQPYLAKKVYTILKKRFKNAEFSVSRVTPEEAGFMREKASRFIPSLRKKEIQGAASHVLDAAFVLAASIGDNKILKNYLPNIGDKIDPDNKNHLKAFLPASVNIRSVERIKDYSKKTRTDYSGVSIFKDTIYGERFLPILIDKNQLYIGFKRENSLVVEGEYREKWFQVLKPFLLYKNNEIDQSKSAKDWSEGLDREYIRFSVNKNKAFRFFEEMKAANDMVATGRDVAIILFGIRYSVLKTDLIRSLYNEQKKEFNDKSSILKDDNFYIKIDIKGIDKNVYGKIGECKVIAPFRQEWEKLLDHAEIKKVLGKKKADTGIDLPSVLKQIYLNNSHQPRNYRVKTRKVFSLPVIDGPSGGYRIHRINPSNGESVYQLVCINKSKSKGFTVSCQNIVDFDKPIQIPYLDGSNITALESDYQNMKNNICPNDQWVKIGIPKSLKNVLELHAQASTSNRSKYSVCMKYEVFNENILTLTDHGKAEEWYDVPTKIKIMENKRKEFEMVLNKGLSENEKLFMFPQVAITISEVSGDKIKFIYTPNARNKYMEEMFNKSFITRK